MLESAVLQTEMPDTSLAMASTPSLIDTETFTNSDVFDTDSCPMMFDDDFHQLLPSAQDNVYEDIAAVSRIFLRRRNVASLFSMMLPSCCTHYPCTGSTET